MKNETPKQTAAMRLYINAGSLEEDADQSGLAHFVEHMAFNGSKNVPEGEMLKLLERQGLAFGADTNAATSYDYTLYQLDLPSVSEEVIDTGLFLMRETAGNLTFSPEAIERERGVVQAEKRRSATALNKNRTDSLAHILNNTIVKERPIIGSDNVLANAPRERFVNFYDRYYRPENAVLVVVGDIDIAVVTDKIKKIFSDWEAKPIAMNEPKYGDVSPDRSIRSWYFSDPDIPTIIRISSKYPAASEPETPEVRKNEFLQLIVNGIINRRIAARILEENAVISQGGAASQKLFGIAQLNSLSLVSDPENWKSALQLGEQELRKAFLHGFTRSEINEQVATLKTLLKNSAEQAASRSNPQLATNIALEINSGRVITSPAYDLTLFEELQPTITADQLLQVFRTLWGQSAPIIQVANNRALNDAEDVILQVYAKSQQVAVAPPTDGEKLEFAYTDFGSAKRIVEDSRIADLETRSLRFANNVRLNIKKTDFEDGAVHVSLRVGNGLLDFPRDIDGLSMIAGVFATGGLQAHSFNELQSLLAGRTVQPALSVGETAFGGISRTTPDDLLFQLQLWAAYITAPGYRPEGEALWAQQAPLFDQLFTTEPVGVLRTKGARLIRNGDVRFGIGETKELLLRNFAELSTVLDRSLREGAIEITIVGDIEDEAAIAAVANTFGALPQRRIDQLKTPDALKVSFPEDRTPVTLRHKGAAERAVSAVYWKTTDAQNVKTEATMTLLANILRLKITERVREELGAAYTSSATSEMSPVFKGFGNILAFAEVEADNVDQIITIIEELGNSLSTDGAITEDELLRARKPELELLETQQSTNAYWVSELAAAQGNPERLTKTRGLKAAYEAVTISDLKAAAEKYLKNDTSLQLRVVAEGK
ncbi:M16 family metallopeptidase [Parasphingorhabdus sp. DH2-15]|uniref:M16 family metallopeptidase n=1 Tax=Parasphingorhabdus sp. DH2-15 TaxID=3444112 RepID=UPI003F68810E